MDATYRRGRGSGGGGRRRRRRRVIGAVSGRRRSRWTVTASRRGGRRRSRSGRRRSRRRRMGRRRVIGGQSRDAAAKVVHARVTVARHRVTHKHRRGPRHGRRGDRVHRQAVGGVDALLLLSTPLGRGWVGRSGRGGSAHLRVQSGGRRGCWRYGRRRCGHRGMQRSARLRVMGVMMVMRERMKRRELMELLLLRWRLQRRVRVMKRSYGKVMLLAVDLTAANDRSRRRQLGGRGRRRLARSG